MWSISLAQKIHIPALAGIIREANQDVAERFDLNTQNAPKHPSNCTDSWIESSMADGVQYYLLKAGDRYCGCVALEKARPGGFYLERLAVLPADRHQGYGAALVRFASQEAIKAGCLRLEIGIIAENIELKQWYTRLGYQTGATKKLEHLPFDVLYMHRDLK